MPHPPAPLRARHRCRRKHARAASRYCGAWPLPRRLGGGVAPAGEGDRTRAQRSAERVALLLEQGALLAEKLDRPEQAVEVLEAALAFQPDQRRRAGRDVPRGAAGGGLGEVGAGAGGADCRAGRPSVTSPSATTGLGAPPRRVERSSARSASTRDPTRAIRVFRPTLERLSEICFDRQQWDNAWKATEHLIDRHGADMEPGMRAELALRSALADLHVAQRIAAVARVAAMPGIPCGWRRACATWRTAGPRCGSIRACWRRSTTIAGPRPSRLREVLSLTERTPAHPARETARATWAVMAMADRRWADAVEVLDTFGSDPTLDAAKTLPVSGRRGGHPAT